MDTKQLRQKVLDLAIRGKLVPQNPSDEPASTLLERIRKEKDLLIKEGKIKRDKKEVTRDTSHYRKNAPFELPEGWVWCRLGDIGSWSSGSTPSRNNLRYYYTGTIPWLKTGDLNDGDITEVPEKVTGLALQECSLRLNPVGSVLIAMYGATIGRLGILNVEATTNQACCACIVTNVVDKKYLFYYLLSQRKEFQSKAEGGAQPNISKDKIVNTLIALPPLSEQHRIISAIEKIFTLIDQIEKDKLSFEHFIRQGKSKVLNLAIRGKLVSQDPKDKPASALLKKIKKEKAALAKTGKKTPKTTDDSPHYRNVPFEVPQSWVWCKLGDIGNWASGSTPSRNNSRYYYEGAIPWLKTGDLSDGDITATSEKVTKLALQECSLRLNPAGSVLIAMYGATIGKLGILNIDSTTNQACCACIPTKSVEKKYLFYYLLSQRTYFQNKAEGGAQPNISKDKIIHTLMPLPPLAEQQRIILKIESIFNQLDRIAEMLKA